MKPDERLLESLYARGWSGCVENLQLGGQRDLLVILRKLPPFVSRMSGFEYDALSFPFLTDSTVDPEVFVKDRALMERLRKSSILSLKLFSHSISDNWKSIIEWDGSANIVVSCTNFDEAEYLDAVGGKLRNLLRKFERGFHAECVAKDSKTLFDVSLGYKLFMARINGDVKYDFSFVNLLRCLQLDDRLRVFVAKKYGSQDVAAAVIFKVSNNRADYLLGFKDAVESDNSTMAGLLFYGLKYMKSNYGLRNLYLGGGLTYDENDPLLLFKRKIGNSVEKLQVKTYSLIDDCVGMRAWVSQRKLCATEPNRLRADFYR